MRIEKIRGHEQAQCYIIHEGLEIKLVSYRTVVLIYNVIDKTIECTGLYSMTTRKHIGWFMNQYIQGYNYHDVKHAYENNYILELKGGN
jgi:hypothetical protein